MRHKIQYFAILSDMLVTSQDLFFHSSFDDCKLVSILRSECVAANDNFDSPAVISIF